MASDKDRTPTPEEEFASIARAEDVGRAARRQISALFLTLCIGLVVALASLMSGAIEAAPVWLVGIFAAVLIAVALSLARVSGGLARSMATPKE